VVTFNDQVAVVTGAGRGLGRQYALDLARRGAAVVVNDLGCSMTGDGEDPSVADAVVDEIRAEGGTAVASHHSVVTPEGGAGIVQTAVEAFGRLDAVVSNAGIMEMLAFEDIAPENWRRMIETHLTGSFHVSQPAYRVMKAQGYGRFVFISSSAGAFGMPLASHYGAAKAGIIGLTNNIAFEGAVHGILANAVLPFGLTRMATIAGEPEEGSLLAISSTELVSPLVVFLASRDCTFTHQYFSACAGRYARAFIGLGDGCLPDRGQTPTPEDIQNRLEEVASTEAFMIPMSLVDEMQVLAHRLGLGR
jgi:NAD(P)-dependent dehydrogenase (short-subunit alcohol dehydrogenase family)